MGYNKLVRDKIPEIIKNNGENPIFHIADEKEYFEELKKKLIEECNEVVEDEKIEEEIADVIEVIYSILKFKNISFEEIEKIRKIKKEKNGGFDKKIILDDVKK